MIDSSLGVLSDREAIKETISNYAIGIDLRDWKLYRSCFTAEVDIDFSSWNGAPAERMPAERWVANVTSVLQGFDSTQHFFSVYRINLDGDRASTVVYMQARHNFAHEGEVKAFTIGGYYSHRLERVAGGWKLAAVRLTVTWSEGDRGIFELAARRA